ncbi:MAG: glycosyltransferase, partial [Phormidium sp.]
MSINCMEISLSVALVTRNRPESLERCLKSWRNQTVSPFEIVVSDDSDDVHAPQIERLAKQFDCIYTKGPRRGLYANRNHASLTCRGTHILSGDDDHTHPIDYVEKVLEVVETDPARVWIFTEKKHNQPESSLICPTELHPSGGGCIPKDPSNCAAIADGSSVYPRQIFDQGLRYDETYSFGPMWYLWGKHLIKQGWRISFSDATFIWHHDESEQRFHDQNLVNTLLESTTYTQFVNSLWLEPSLSKLVISIIYLLKRMLISETFMWYKVKTRINITSAFRTIKNAYNAKNIYPLKPLTKDETKLVLITPSYPPLRGGISDYAQQLVRALSTFYKVNVVTSQGLGEGEWENIYVHNSTNFNWQLQETFKLIRVVKQLKPQVILFQEGDEYRINYINLPRLYLNNLWFSMLLPLVLRIFLRCPVFVIIHEGVGKRQLFQSKLSTGVIVVEKYYLESFFNLERIKYNAKWIPIGSNIPRVELTEQQKQDIRKSLGINSSERAVGFFGYVNSRKGFDLLVEALELLSTELPMRLIIIGQSAEQNISNTSFSVDWTGYLEPQQVASILASMDVCVFPFPDGARWRYTSLLAALVQDVPVVTAPGLQMNLDGVYEYRAGDSVNLSEKISEVLKTSQKVNRKIHD